MRNTNISDLHPVMRLPAANLIALCSRKTDLPFRLYEGYRTPERQNELYAQKPVVTRARGWTSAHQFGLAIDMVGWVNNQWSWEEQLPWELLKEAGESVGLLRPLVWDKVHFEHPGWVTARTYL